MNVTVKLMIYDYYDVLYTSFILQLYNIYITLHDNTFLLLTHLILITP